MTSSPPSIRIHGIKLSNRLVLVDYKGRAHPTATFSCFFDRINQNRINLPFITTRSIGDQFHISCCAATEDKGRLEGLLTSQTGFEGTSCITHDVGIVSLFPHQSDFRLPGICLSVFTAVSLPIYGFATSLSTFTVVTDYIYLESAVAAIRNHIDLPPGYQPMKPEFRITQAAEKKGRA